MKLYLFAATVAISLGTSAEVEAQTCSPPQPPATSAEFVEWLECTLGELVMVWEEDVLVAIDQTHDTVPASRLDLEYVSGCDFSPRLEDIDGDGQLEVIVNSRLLIPQMALSQAILWYVIAPDGVTSANQHLDYLDDILLPTVREDVRRCSRDGARGRFSAVNIPSVFASNTELHPIFLSLDTPATRRIGDFIGALPTFFAMIHEVGHAALHLGEEAASGLAKELEADRYAADVFAANEVPLTLGLGFFLLAYDLNRAGPSADIACRVVALARSAESARFPKEFNQVAQSRVEALHREYIARYNPRCKP